MVRNGLDFQLLLLSDPAKSGHSAVPRSGYKIIPVGELGVRAKYELPKTRPVVVDCSAGSIPQWFCQEAVLLLLKEQIPEVIAVDLATRTASDYCEASRNEYAKP